MLDTNIIQPSTLAGTPRQVEWANKIRSYYQELAKVGSQELPEIRSATFWIENRNATIDELIEVARSRVLDLNYVGTQFTTHYSRYGRIEAKSALSMLTDAVVLDTETSGLQSAKTSEVIELSIIRLSSGEVLFNSLLKPFHEYGTKRTEKAESIHKISKEELEVAPSIADVYPCLHSLLVSNQLICYNDKFDIPMIRRSIAMWGYAPPRLYSTCAMKLFSAYMESDEWYSLDDACTMMHINRTQFGEAHRSLTDTLATRSLLQLMKEGD